MSFHRHYEYVRDVPWTATVALTINLYTNILMLSAYKHSYAIIVTRAVSVLTIITNPLVSERYRLVEVPTTVSYNIIEFCENIQPLYYVSTISFLCSTAGGKCYCDTI